jgi:hypothetical protein
MFSHQSPAHALPLLVINTEFLSSSLDSPLESNTSGLLSPYSPGFFGNNFVMPPVLQPSSPLTPLYTLTDVAAQESTKSFHCKDPYAKSGDEAEEFACPRSDCKKVFTSKYRLKSHSVSHSNRRPYQWYLHFLMPLSRCLKAFSRYHDILRHVRNIHKVDKLNVGDWIEKRAEGEVKME